MFLLRFLWVFFLQACTSLQLMAFLDRFAFRNPKKRNVVYSEAEAARKAKGSVAGDAAGPVLGEQSMGDVEAEIAEAYAMMAGEQDKFGAVKKGLLRGTSKMQPRLPKRGRVALDAPANSAQFRSLAPYQVREDDVRPVYRTYVSVASSPAPCRCLCIRS